MPEEVIAPASLPPITEQEVWKRIASSDVFFIQNCLQIVDEKGKLVPFILRRPQRLYVERRTNFDFALKSRKEGISSFFIASDIWACAFKKNQHCILLAHTKDEAKIMLEERVKPLLKNCIIPIEVDYRASEIIFRQTNSRYYIGTAGSKKFGRGSDITRYHLSEYAHYETTDVLPGIEEGCVDGAIGRLETTANGENFAKILWDAGMNGQSKYNPIFLPWYCSEKYCIPEAEGKIYSLSEEERKLREVFSLTDGQIAWRREKIRSMSRPELFQQEYPETDNQAFLSSGRMVFDWISLLRHKQHCKPPVWRGRLVDLEYKVDLEPSNNGSLRVWHVPQQGHEYVIGADVAEGIDGGAYSAGCVLDLDLNEQVAEWHGHIAPDLFAEALLTLSKYYNNARIAPESWPGPGEVTCSHLMEADPSRVWSDINVDKPGWVTTSKSKQRMIHQVGAAIRDLEVVLRSPDLLSELKSYIYTESGTMEPSTGTFSDRVIALAIAWQMARSYSPVSSTSFKGLHSFSFSGKVGGVSVPEWKGPRMGVRDEG